MRNPLLFALAVLLAGLVPHGRAATHRVALGTFTSDENTWESLQAAETIPTALQAALGNLPGIEWVERREFGAVLREQALVAFGTSLKAARLARADWMITGRFVSAQPAGHELVLEAIDLAHADVLAEQRVTIPGEGLREAPGSLPALAAGVRSLLDAAAKRESAVAGLPTIAVLFFPDIDGFQHEFEAALADPKWVTGRYRLLRLPRASLATEEAELVLAGFAEDESGAWRSLADAYVWGTLKKRRSGSIDGEEITDARTPEIVLNVWDGKLTPVSFAEESEPVDRAKFPEALRAQARRLAGSVAEFVRQPRAGARDDTQRVRISRGLVRAAEDLDAHKAYNANYLSNPEGRRHYLNMVQTLEAACFLDPQNAVALEKLTRFRWSSLAGVDAKNPGRFQMGRREAWGRYVERFGLKLDDPSSFDRIQALMKKEKPDFEEINRLMQAEVNTGWPVAHEFLHSALEAAARPDYPHGIPDEEAENWSDRLTREVARRTLLVAEVKNAFPIEGLSATFNNRLGGPFSIHDPKYRLEVLEQIWPKLTIPTRQTVAARLRQAIALTYRQAGRPGEEERLFGILPPVASTPPPVSARPPAAPPRMPGGPFPFGRREVILPYDLFNYQPLSIPAPELPAPLEAIEALAKPKIRRVLEMVTLAGRLWMIVEAPDDTAVTGPNAQLLEDFHPAEESVKRLYCFDPATSALHRVEAAQRFAPYSLFVHGGRLWVSFGKDSVAVFDPKTETMRRFGRDEGLTAEGAYRFAVAGGKLLVTNGSDGLYEFDAPSERWRTHAVAALEYKGTRYGGELRSFAGLGPWLLLTRGPVAVENTRSGAWRSYQTLNANGSPLWAGGEANAVAADATGFWINSGTALSHLDPVAGRFSDEIAIPNPKALRRVNTAADTVNALAGLRAAVQPETVAVPPWRSAGYIPGPVDAVLPDGDFLWLTARALPTFKSWQYLMLWHRPSRRWVGQYKIEGMPALAMDDKYLWISSAGPGEKWYTQANLRRVEKRLAYATPAKAWAPALANETEAHAAYAKLSVRDQAFNSFARGRYAEAAALFAQVPPTKIQSLQINPAAEALFMQALCYDAQGLSQPDKQRALLEEFLQRFPEDALAAEVRRQLATLPPPSPP